MTLAVLSSTPGRMRVHVPGCAVWGPEGEKRVGSIPGVSRCSANSHTQNFLVQYDPAVIDRVEVLEKLGSIPWDSPPSTDGPDVRRRPLPPIREKTGARTQRLRIPVRNLERDPELGRRLIDILQRRPGVKARANPLTGRVLVEFATHVVDAAEVLAEVAELDAALVPLPGEDSPSHPLDRSPVWRSVLRTTGAMFGIGFIVAKRLLGQPIDSGLQQMAVRTAAMLGLVQSYPFVRRTLHNTVGRSVADAMLYTPMLISLTLSEGVMGLLLTGSEAATMLSEVMSRRKGWREYEQRLGDAPSVHAGALIRIEAGQRVPHFCRIVEGDGTTVGPQGQLVHVGPAREIAAGSRLHGGPFVVEVVGEFKVEEPPPRPPAPNTLTENYVHRLNLVSLGYAALRFVMTRSPGQALEAMMLVNPRPALVGSDMASIAASSRVMKAGVVVVGTRPRRAVRQPNVVILQCVRMLVEGYELTGVLSLGAKSPEEVLARATGISLACGSPWGSVLPPHTEVLADDGVYTNGAARGIIEGHAHVLRTASGRQVHQLAHRPLPPEQLALLLEEDGVPQGLILLRPRMRAGLEKLKSRCLALGIELFVLGQGNPQVEQPLAAQAQVLLLTDGSAITVIRDLQATGHRVAYVTDHVDEADAFWAADMSIGLSAGQSAPFPGRADFLAPDLAAVAALMDAGALREKAARDAVGVSIVANAVGAYQGLRTTVGLARASYTVYWASLATLAWSLWRLRGGSRATRLPANDPRPERWGRRSVANVFKAVSSTPTGLAETEAAKRRRSQMRIEKPSAWVESLTNQLDLPITKILGVAAVVALLAEAPLDFLFVVATLGINIGIGLWQERTTGQVQEALDQLASPKALVLRGPEQREVPAQDVVVGDVLVLSPGQRVAADARLFDVSNLEIDEASLTGESHPVRKVVERGFDAQRVVLAGTDVVAGRGRAVVFAVGRQSRFGATVTAASLDPGQSSALGKKIGNLFQGYMPLAVIGGLTVTVSNFARAGFNPAGLVTGAAVALAAIPEGLPLLSGVGEASVAKRLGKAGATVRRLASVEALGRVTVACTDKTGTLTEGRLRLVELHNGKKSYSLPDSHATARKLLQRAALACSALDPANHPTDRALLAAAQEAGCEAELTAERSWELPFSSSRGIHCTYVDGRIYAKGAPERLLPLCGVSAAESEAWLKRVEELASRGLRVLMVASGDADHAPSELPETPLGVDGLVGLRDPLRASARAAVAQCREAGVRLLILTGDHPVTARTIASELGFEVQNGEAFSAPEMSEMTDEALDLALSRAIVVARATPLDKLRIIESLQRQGEVVAMTGDGVNDAPALRLADVGVAMGRSGTVVARQAADVVLQDDDFSKLVEALIEGRFFWRNMRRSLSLLLGGNLGELTMVVLGSLVAFHSPLTTRQILAVNLITDALPAMSIVLQKPRTRDLSTLGREGHQTWDASLRNAVLRRGLATSMPSLFGFGFVLYHTGNVGLARTQAFASIVGTQLAQTLDAGRTDGSITGEVVAAVGTSVALLAAALVTPGLREVLNLTAMGPGGIGLTLATSASAVVISRVLGAGGAVPHPHQKALPAPVVLPALPVPNPA